MTKRLLVPFILVGTILSAQEFRATLQGSVTDPSRASIAGAEVVLRNVDTAVERKALTDNAGYYLFQFLPPGAYALTARAAGFKTDVRDGIRLSLGENVRLDLELSVGQASETISVVGDVSAVQAESSSLGSVVRQAVIDSLPRWMRHYNEVHPHSALGYWPPAMPMHSTTVAGPDAWRYRADLFAGVVQRQNISFPS